LGEIRFRFGDLVNGRFLDDIVLRTTNLAQEERHESHRFVVRYYARNPFTSENLPDLEKKFFFEGERRRPYLVRFSVLLVLSTIIASGGILADSTTTVIGAMIIAPLMTPILATTAALGDGPNKAVVSKWADRDRGYHHSRFPLLANWYTFCDGNFI
jgi:hypothetical protein